MNKIEVSVIMPAYNAEQYIGEAVQSVINQSFTRWELIVVDDGSTDNTEVIVKKLAQKDNRIIYLYQTNGKQGKARNLGISVAKGRFLAFLDADDLWLPQKLELTLKEFADDIDLVFTNGYLLSDEKQIYQEPIVMGINGRLYEGIKGFEEFLFGNKIPTLTVVARKEPILKVGSFCDSIVDNIYKPEDYDLWLKLLYNGAKLKSINIPLSVYRVHDSSTTASDREATSGVMEILKNFIVDIPDFANQYRSQIRHWFKKYLLLRNIDKGAYRKTAKILGIKKADRAMLTIISKFNRILPAKYFHLIYFRLL